LNLNIRPIQSSDPPVFSAAFTEIGWDKAVEFYQKYLREQENSLRKVLVATVDDQFAGYVTVICQSGYKPFQDAGISEIQDFNVRPKFRKNGIGTALMDRAEELVSERVDIVGIGVGMYADYGTAQRMYVKRGYVPDGRGLTYKGRVLEPGEKTVNDDDLILYFVKNVG